MDSKVYILLFIVGIQFGKSSQQQQLKKLRNRLNNVELQMSRETFRTRTDIAELRGMIEQFNATGGAWEDESLSSARSADVVAAITELETEIKEASNIQDLRITSIARALSAEKKRTRQRVTAIEQMQENKVIGTVDEIERELNQVKQVNDRLLREVHRSKQETEELRGLIVDLQENMEKLGDASVMIPVNRPPCPDGWVKFQHMCYLYVKNERITWHGAELRCDDLGGVLAQPDTEEKLRYILQAVDSQVWLGASDDEKEGTWVWSSSQKPVQFFLWESGQPNSYGGDQDCLEKGTTQLNDESCMQENTYVCQQTANV